MTTDKLIEDMARAIRNATCETRTYPFTVWDQGEAEANIREWCRFAARAALAIAFPAIRERCAAVAEQNGTAFSGQAAFIAKEIRALSLDAPPAAGEAFKLCFYCEKATECEHPETCAKIAPAAGDMTPEERAECERITREMHAEAAELLKGRPRRYNPAAPAPATEMVLVPRELIERFPEINPSNYDHDDACALNTWGCEVVTCALAAAKAPTP